MYRPLSESPLAFVDTETGGLDTNTAALLEVAIITTDITGRHVRVRWQAKLMPYPEDVMQPEALRVNGFNNVIWQADSVPALEAYQTILSLGRGAIFAAHNVPFDYGMIMRFLGRFDCHDWPGPHWKVDTVSLAWPLLAKRLVPDLKLTTLTHLFNIPHENAHTALADAEAARLVYVALMDLYSAGSATQLHPARTVIAPRARFGVEGEVLPKSTPEQLDNEHHQVISLPDQSPLPGV